MTTKVEHERCPNCAKQGKDRHGDNLAVWPDGGSHCFACGYHVSAKETLTEMAQRVMKPFSMPLQAGVEAVPDDCVQSFPPEVASWLLECNYAPEDLTKGDILYSPKWRRTIFPLYQKGQYIGWTGRADSDDHRPKWYHQFKMPHGLVYSIKNTDAPPDVVVLVEDIVSAERIATQYNTACIFGLHLGDGQITTLARDYLQVIIWLDDYAASQALQLAGRLSAYGVEAHIIWTRDDPKLFDDGQIREHISGSLGLGNVEAVSAPKAPVTPMDPFPFPKAAPAPSCEASAACDCGNEVPASPTDNMPMLNYRIEGDLDEDIPW